MAQAKKPYHKENLRQDLLDAGRAFVQQNGHINLSMRTLAQAVDVSPGAPYHHFPDRRALLLSLAVEGFEEMLAGARAALAGVSGTPARLRALGLHFIDFADANPHLIDLMYESELTAPALDPQLLSYQVTAHTTLRAEIAAAVPGLSPAEADLRSISFWSAIYGFATMRRKGVIHSGGAEVDMAKLSTAIVDRAVLMAIAV